MVELNNEMKKLVNKVYCGDSLEVLKTFPNESIDMVITSPPYDTLRTYDGFKFDFCGIAKELSRVLKQVGVIMWVVGDETKDGSETGTSFKQALYFKQKCGLNIHDTMIWQKTFLKFPDFIRYYQSFEYMFVFSKGRPKTINILQDKRNMWAGAIVSGLERDKDGVKKKRSCAGQKYKDFGVRWNVWAYKGDIAVDLGEPQNLTEDKIRDYISKGYIILDPRGNRCNIIDYKNTNAKAKETGDHPAVFPPDLVRDHLETWSEEMDIILDPFSGSGTVAIEALSANRYYISIDTSEKYCEIQKKRLKGIGLFHEVAQINNNG